MVKPCLHVLVLVLAAVARPVVVRAQDIEPRSYANAPIGVNFLVGGYAYAWLGFPLDPAVPLTDPDLNTSNAIAGYARVLNIGGQSARISLLAPYAWLKGSALYKGEPVSREVNGFTDAKLRLAVNLLGAPAMDMASFKDYKQDLIVGASVTASAPIGQYDPERLVNIGANRWSFKGEVGASKAAGRWILELSSALEAFTTNSDFFGGITREQDPVWSIKGNIIRNFPKSIWASLDGTYFAGGTTVLDGTRRNDLQQNWRAGVTVALPVNKRNSIKLYGSTGVYARTGNNFDLVGLVWQYRWGAGL
jgi:hypothetical protein